jgi:RNA-directed DNA polymerase
MESKHLYTEDLWLRFKNKFGETQSSFKLKKYPHFDPYFDFYNLSAQIKRKVADSSLKSISSYPFLPFVKILTKTPRYRYQEDKASYNLETKIRPISFASHFDSYIYAFYAFALTEKYQEYIRERKFDECVLAYRTDLNGLCNIQFAKEAFNKVREQLHQSGSCIAIALDITGYFDNIDHQLLKEKWCKVLKLKELPADQYQVYRSLTKYAYVNYTSYLKHFKISIDSKRKTGVRWQSLLDLMDNDLAGSKLLEKFRYLRSQKLVVTNQPKVNKKTKEIENRGIPQGSSMSAVLSNIYLIDFDEYVHRLSKKYGFTYRRYCDDLLIICKPSDQVELANSIINEIENKYSLTIQTKKADIINFSSNSKGKIRGFNVKKIIKQNATVNDLNEAKYYKSLQYLGFEFNGQDIFVRSGSLSKYFQKLNRRVVKTIMMAYSSKSKSLTIKRKQLYEKYSHLGKRNFLSYVLDASKMTYTKRNGVVREGMDSIAMEKQVSRHFQVLEQEISKTSEQHFTTKENINKKRVAEGKRIKKNQLKI